MTHRLTQDEARRLVVRAQLLDADRPGDVFEVAEQLTQIKIDPTATIATCEQTVLWSRIGDGYEPGQLVKAVEDDRLLFEFDGTFRPMSMLPLMLPGMRAWPTRTSSRAWLDANARFRRDVLDRLRGEGPLRAGDIPDTAQVARAPDGWSGSNQVTPMLEFLLRRGEVAVAGRVGRQRLWDLAERVYPADVAELDAEGAQRALQARRLRAAGITRRSAWSGVGDAGETAMIDGLPRTWRVDPDAIRSLGDDPGGRVAFLNPYDSLLSDRRRLAELFDFDYVLEQFKPSRDRVYGYFAHPILLGDRFVGMLDAALDRDAAVLRVHAMHEFMPWDDEERDAVLAELDALARWLGVPVTGV